MGQITDDGIDITTYSLCSLAFILWAATLTRMIVKKPQTEILAVISCLMIMFQVCFVMNRLFIQTEGKAWNFIFSFVYDSAFNLSPWLFAYNYWALSWRVQLLVENKPEDFYDGNLFKVCVIVGVYCVLTPAIQLVLITFFEN